MKRLKIKDKKYFFVCLAIIAVAIVSRFIFLGVRPLHHDEGMLSYFAWQLARVGDYTYTPQIHSPILFFVQALLFIVFGARDAICKVGPAIFGVVLVALPLFFHKLLTKKIAIFVSLGFLISPVFLYYSRFLVHTTMVVVFWLLFLFLFYRFIKKQSSAYLYLSSISLALAFGTSESSYIFMAIIALYFLCLGVFFPRSFRIHFKRWWQIFSRNYLDFITAGLIFVLVWVAIYSVGFTNPESLRRSLPILWDESTGLGFWLAQHPKRLGGQPWHYYLMLAGIYEIIFVFGSLGYVKEFIFSKKTPISVFLIVWLFGSLTAYSWAGEKFPWLFLPSLLPMVIVTGIFLGRNWQRFRLPAKIFWIVAALWTCFVAVRLVYISPADTDELAVYVQTPNSFQEIINKISDDCKDSPAECVLVDHDITWPLSWSFRDHSTLILTENYSLPPGAKYLIIGSDNIASTEKPQGMKEEAVWIRDWWVPEKCAKQDLSCLGKYLKYYFLRQTWNDKGGYTVYIYSK